MTIEEDTDRPVLDPSGIGEFVKHGGCPMFAKLRYEGDEVEESRNWKEAFQPLSPLLSEEGNRFENDIYDSIEPDATNIIDSWRDYDNQPENNQTILDEIENAAEMDADEDPILLEQAHFADEIEVFYVAGDSDLIFLWPEDGDSVRIRIFDIKASWEEKPYHQVQTSTYSILLRKLLEDESPDYNYTVETGIITRETELDSLEPEDLPSFEPETRESDIRELLREDGVLDRTFGKDVEDVPHQFDSHCKNCPYNEACITRAIERLDIRLLGLSRGEQEALRKYGFETLSDVADLIEVQEETRPYEYEYPDIKPAYSDKVQELSEEHSVGERLPILAQKAQALLGELRPNDSNAHDKPWAPWIIGSGSGSLPEDDPPWDVDDDEMDRGSLIRVYLNVQWDYLRDRIAVMGGRVDCTNYNGTPLTFSESIQGIPDDEEAQAEQEEQLLGDFFEKLFGAVELIAEKTGQPDEAPIHMYFYTAQERDAMMDAVKRHPHLQSANSIRDMLGLRSGIDQSMVSVIQDEVENRLALKTISTGLLPVLEQTFPSGDHKMEYSDWVYYREDGTKIQLRDAFFHRLFDYQVQYKETFDGMRLLLDGGQSDGFYPSRARFDAQMPLEYIWAAEGIDELDESWTDNPQYKGIIRKFMWADESDGVRITCEDLMALTEKFCEGIEHIERGLRYKNHDIEKEPLDIDSLSEFTLGESNLADACREYLDLEYATTKQDTLEHYQKPIKQRILSGKSVPIRVKNAREENGLLYLDAELIYDEFDFKSPEYVANSTRQKGSSGSTSGSRMVATPMYKEGDQFKADANRPDYIMNSTPVSVQSMDTNNMKVTLRGFPNAGSKDDDYRTWHKHYTVDEDNDDGTLFQEGEIFILDPASDDLTSQRSATALDHADANEMYNAITDLIEGGDTTAVERFDEDKVNEITEWFVENYDPSPNERQRDFITDVSGEISLLQGPPGTGKTSGAIALAITARLYADAGPVRTLVTGASNKAVDEMMEDVAGAINAYEGDELSDTKIVRLVGDKPQETIDGVDYVNYHEDEEEMDILWERLRKQNEKRQSSLSEHDSDASPHIVLFATPSRTFGLAKNLADRVGFDVEEAYEHGMDLFDLYAADEASMLPLPQLLMGGAFLDEDAGWQALISGDQRQMPPVQKHDWMTEDRRTVAEVAPFLSTLDYFRFLRGEDIEALEEFDDVESPESDIPITRLQETYRCHKQVADFLQRWVYSKDDIDYSSSLTYKIPEPESASDSVSPVLNPDTPITLVLHDDERSRQSNQVEASIARDVVDAIPAESSVGIVTPHNSQKGLLESVCNRGQVDTVERFQGGERDVMIVSATVSDPDYLSDESDFILNPNRLNVALSRMRKKLIVLAPKSLFRMIPEDIDGYENSMIWKGLYSEVEPNGESEWEGSLDDFSVQDVIGEAEANIEVYSKDSE